MQPPSQQQNTGLGGTASELKSDARQLSSKAADRLHTEVDARKDTAVTQAQSVSSAVRQAADGLDEGAPEWLRSAFQQGADQIQRFAQSLEQKDSRQLLNDVQSFARERPALFLGAAAAAGFAAARVLKAGGEQHSAQQFGGTSQWDQAQPWGDGNQGSDSNSSFTQTQPFAQSGAQSGTLGEATQDDNPMFQSGSAGGGTQASGRGETFGQQLDEGLSSGGNDPLIARRETDSPTSTRMGDDPLVLTPDDATGTRTTRTGDY
jgi:hypothetical protein